MPDWIFWMPSDASLNGMLWFAGIIWVAHVATSLSADAVFHWMHTRKVLPQHQVSDGAAPPDRLVKSAWIDRAIAYPIFLGVLALGLYPLFVWRGGDIGAPWPGPLEIAGHLAVFVFVNDTIFYWSHRLLHNKRLFRLIHRKHHTFRHVRAVSCEYAHPVENVCNLIALYAGPVLMGSAFPIWVIWQVIRMIETCDAHSGYQLDPVASRHAFHHRHPTKGCYGTGLGFWDWVMGTDRDWRAAPS